MLVTPAVYPLPQEMVLQVGCSGWVSSVYVSILPVWVLGTLPALCVISKLNIQEISKLCELGVGRRRQGRALSFSLLISEWSLE